MTLSGALEYLEHWHLFLPGSSWLFVGNYVHFYYSLYQQTSSLTSGKKLLPFFSICALVLIHPVKHLLSAYCMHCSSWQSGSRSQILPHTLSSCFILPPTQPSHCQRMWHPGRAQQTSPTSESGVGLGEGCGGLGAVSEGSLELWGAQELFPFVYRLSLFYTTQELEIASGVHTSTLQKFMFKSLRRRRICPN